MPHPALIIAIITVTMTSKVTAVVLWLLPCQGWYFVWWSKERGLINLKSSFVLESFCHYLNKTQASTSCENNSVFPSFQNLHFTQCFVHLWWRLKGGFAHALMLCDTPRLDCGCDYPCRCLFCLLPSSPVVYAGFHAAKIRGDCF